MTFVHEFVGGSACLDFINTVGGHRDSVHDDKLRTYADFLEWTSISASLPDAQIEVLAGQARSHPDAAAKMLRRAKGFREKLHTLFDARLRGRVPPNEILESVNVEIGNAMSHARLSRKGADFVWVWENTSEFDAPLWPIARATGELLTSSAVTRLRECASDICGWLFLDLSKNGSRRWCDMKGCGNREKLRRYRDNQRDSI